MKFNKRFISSLYILKISALISIMLLVSTIFVYKPMKSVSNYTGPNSMLGSMVQNLNLTGNDDSSYEINYSHKVSTNEIFKYILKYSNYIDQWEARGLAQLIKKECKKYNINPYLILAIIKVESGFNPTAVSSRGAVGLMQIMPDTAIYLANKKGINIENEMSL